MALRLNRREVATLTERGFYLPSPLLRPGFAGEARNLLRMTFEPRAYAVGDVAVRIDPFVDGGHRYALQKALRSKRADIDVRSRYRARGCGRVRSASSW